jgi:hypothetical protein
MSVPDSYSARDFGSPTTSAWRASRWAGFEGYFSLILMLFLVTGNVWGLVAERVISHWLVLERVTAHSLVLAIGFGAFLFACVFAVSGVRSNRGGSRVAALVSSAMILYSVFVTFKQFR